MSTWRINQGGLFLCCLEHLEAGLRLPAHMVGSLCHAEMKQTICLTCGTYMVRNVMTWQWKGTT